MSRIAIATDSNSGITQAQAKELGIFVLPMPFYINDELFLEDITLTQEQFYQKLEEGADVKTTQPAPGDVIEFWDKILQDYDEIVHIPMSSGLSSTCETAEMLSEDYGGKVQVVNNQRISVTQRQSALDALALAAAGWSAREIKELLEKTKFDSDIYITVDTLKYLKKGGRCTPAAAAIGTGTVEDGACNISLGTSGTVFIASDRFEVDPHNALHAFAHADGGFHLRRL